MSSESHKTEANVADSLRTKSNTTSTHQTPTIDSTRALLLDNGTSSVLPRTIIRRQSCFPSALKFLKSSAKPPRRTVSSKHRNTETDKLLA